MSDETEQARENIFRRIERTVETDAERIVAAVESWYAKHFHRAAVEGRAPISTQDKADLIAAVSQAKE